MRVAYYDIELGSIFLGDLFYSTDVWNPCSMRRTELQCSKYGYETVYDILYCQGDNNYDTVFTQSDNYVRSQWQRINVEPMFKDVRKGIVDFCNTILVKDTTTGYVEEDFDDPELTRIFNEAEDGSAMLSQPRSLK